MSELADAYKNYAETETLANMDINQFPPAHQPGHAARKRQAELQLDGAKRKYELELKGALFGMFVTGDGAPDFANIAPEVADVVAVDGTALYKRLAERVRPTLGARGQFGVGHFAVVLQELREIGLELGVQSLPSPTYTEAPNVGDEKSLIAHMRSMVESSGTELSVKYLAKQIVDAALKNAATANTVPVVLYGVTEEVSKAAAEQLFVEGRTTQVSTTNQVTPESVTETFVQLKKQLKNSKKKN